jgi:hypothetical protein
VDAEAWRRGVEVTYLVSGQAREPIQQLLSVTDMNRIIGVVLVGDA